MKLLRFELVYICSCGERKEIKVSENGTPYETPLVWGCSNCKATYRLVIDENIAIVKELK